MAKIKYGTLQCSYSIGEKIMKAMMWCVSAELQLPPCNWLISNKKANNSQ